jgi:transposase-like protein
LLNTRRRRQDAEKSIETRCDGRFFLEPKQTFQRQYEALRAVFVEAQPIDQVARRFGYKPSALSSMVSRFRADRRRGVTTPFFSPTDADDHSGQAPAKTSHAPNRPKSPTAES